MIAFMKGTLAGIEETKILLEHDGIGYEIFIPMDGRVDRLYTGQELMVHTYLHVREDVLQLYGFLTRDDLEIFRLLLGVNGVGPKAALGILSAISADELRFAVLAEDIKTISKAPGIGRKTAQKLVLELKDKLNLQDAFEKKLEQNTPLRQVKRSQMPVKKQRRLLLPWDTAVPRRCRRCVKWMDGRKWMWRHC